ncbi:hypothetical protein LSG31_18000 [Fodinisporobacter ferrooxydans]|uniref:Uncharacterized protein n=1 Tax=Fodinisporobacter ferrooxydans TaxID=2901836 RepID=A0ABY4CH59_9BACL|nr:hypothetical protein LSG31_18000 [Alicyclobacillaceae bacterium MYW30-H2]
MGRKHHLQGPQRHDVPSLVKIDSPDDVPFEGKMPGQFLNDDNSENKGTTREQQASQFTRVDQPDDIDANFSKK